MNKTREQLLQECIALQELQKRKENNKILWYMPACTVHAGRKPDDFPIDQVWVPGRCPVIPCPESKHTKFHMSRAKIRFVLGGNRSAKTFTITKELLYRMTFPYHPFTKEPFRKGDRHGRVLAQDFSIHEKKHIPEIYEWIPKDSLRDGKKYETKHEAWEKAYDSRNHILHLVNSGWIDFLTYDQDPSKGESVDLDIWCADEEMPEVWYAACNSRLITRSGVGIWAVTPLFGLSWAMDLLDGTNPNVEIFKWGIRDNPYNTEKSINEFLAGITDETREARENGDFIEFKGKVYKELDPQVHFIDAVDPKPYFHVVMAMDPHPRKATVITWAFVDPHDSVVFFDELEMKGTAKEITDAIRIKEANHKARTSLRIIDPAARAQGSNIAYQTDTLKEFEKEGLYFSLADNSESGYNVVHEYLYWDKSKPLSGFNKPSCYFTKACSKTWNGMNKLLWDDWTSRKALRDEKERIKDYLKDFPDCVRYTLALRPSSRQSVEAVNLNFRAY